MSFLLILALSSTSIAVPVGATAGVGVIFWAGLALFREVRRVNKADTLMDAYINRVEADNKRLRDEREELTKIVKIKEDQFEEIIEHIEHPRK
jgi:hypothetical protein